MFVDFFIKRPVFASVCAIIILLVGMISLVNLPVAQFPEIAPTAIQVTSNYSGANAEVVERAVTDILERQINGVEGMRYISSTSSNDGTSSITVTFDRSQNKDIAAVDVQNRVALASPQLPESVNRTGVRVNKESNALLLGIGITSPNGQYDNVFLSNYADRYLVDPLRRITGVGNVRIFGERLYAMRLWVDPMKLAAQQLTMEDLSQALREQNLQVGAGQIGAEPAPPGQEYQLDLRASSQLADLGDFENLIVKSGPSGSVIRFKDIGRVELGAENYNSFLRFRGEEAVGLGIYQLLDSNALEVARLVKDEMARLAENFPEGIEYNVAFDTTEFVQESLFEVVKTLLIAVVLVILVILVFLQDWRSALIPALTIPLALIGTFGFVKLFDFSINSLTLFGLTLATGMVVDDAIIVVEQISRFIKVKHEDPKQAAQEAMGELTGAVIATSLVLMAVFIPVAFFPGTTGALYQQFALTIAFSILLSTFLALTLTPSLCALLLREGQEPPAAIAWFFNWFNRRLERVRQLYGGALQRLVKFKTIVVGVFVLLIGATAWLYLTVPTAFLPDEDQGYFITIIQAPQGVSLQYTSRVMAQVEKELLAVPEITATFAVGGFSFSGNSPNQGIIFSRLKPWGERPAPNQSVQAIIGQMFGKFSQIPEANIFPLNPPPIRGLGQFGGFDFQLQDLRVNSGLDTMVATMGQILGAANQSPDLQRVFSTFQANSPQLIVNVDRNRAKSLGVPVDQIFQTMETALGSSYVNDFVLQGRTYRVYLQADEQFRSSPEDINRLYVRSESGTMIPMANLVKVTQGVGAPIITHYNLFRSIAITGSANQGVSTGQAMNAMAAIARQVMPPGFDFQWSGISLEEVTSQGQAPIIFGLGLLFVFLVLAAQYENYVDPVIILLSVPLAILGALMAQSLRGFPNDVYCQIGLVMLIGLSSKNAILIVEFANQLRAQGYPIVKAALEAAQDRLRPILMTGFSTLFGIFPLAIATGAGAGSRQALGTAVFGGMLVATFLSLFVVPVLYIVVKTISGQLLAPKSSPSEPLPEAQPQSPTPAPHQNG
ncbi:efflux RND transporter permease subunit [Synechocystis sp. FACHB-383]|uniref:efflux RND transporter permease subunit n=1 Tax=Synechocystis sp. FACHB-383 TaxID=2692864 RepID=UPI001688D54B|nr:efflux RND transporter permease subunit [Synechocystis sp. FACHB-383]MBD2655373.1 efflux RND transporter permease subunit [Synechocystis sp. FACHB-383]